MQMKFGGARVCPKCGDDQLLCSDCKDDKPLLGGCTVKCVGCEWEGFSLQLEKRAGTEIEIETEERDET